MRYQLFILVFITFCLCCELLGCDSEQQLTADQGALDVAFDSTDVVEDLNPPSEGGEEPPQEVLTSELYREVPCEDHVGQVGEGLECAFITMPQNRVRETGETSVDVFVVRQNGPHFTSPLPVIVLAGGPGSAHAGFAARKGLPVSMSELLGREVIYYEQRGISPSLPSTLCPELDSAFNPNIAFNDCKDSLEAEGVDIYSYNTIENAADISEIARALGYEQVDVIAGSYGTRLAAQALSRHPDSIRAAILGGVDVPGTDDSYPSSPKFQMTLNQAGEVFGERCAEDADCAFIHPGFDFQEVLSKLEALIERDGSVEIFGAPVTTLEQVKAFGFQMMYIAQIRHLFFGFLYHTAEESIPSYLTHIGEGDPEEGAAFVARLLMSASEAVYGGSSIMSYVTLCYDGSESICEVVGELPSDYPSDEYMSLSGSEHPVMLLSGALDPATPIVNIELIEPKFPNSVRADFECLGHDVSRISNLSNGLCVVEQARAFLDDPNAELPSCAQELCEALPLVPNKTQLLRVIEDYVEGFGE